MIRTQAPTGTSSADGKASHRRSLTLPTRKVFPMKPATIVGILLILFGIIGYATGGLSFTHQKKVVDAGPLQISHQTQDTLPISPILSTISLIAGIGLVVVGAKSR